MIPTILIKSGRNCERNPYSLLSRCFCTLEVHKNPSIPRGRLLKFGWIHHRESFKKSHIKFFSDLLIYINYEFWKTLKSSFFHDTSIVQKWDFCSWNTSVFGLKFSFVHHAVRFITLLLDCRILYDGSSHHNFLCLTF